MKVSQIKNFKMNDAVYKLRRQVINLIYEAKKEIKDLPRIEVRIGEARKKNVLGVAMLKDCKIWITDDAINMGDDALRNVVFHEIVHAVTGFGHDDKCPLMKPNLDGYLLNKNQCMKYLKSYIKYGATIKTMVA
jgi:hypothetical protein|tara:strand:+ start:24 stop:425 length:402 start_codon:yes stop_codon:yes gene_type:complete